jgi:putative transposase
MSVLDSTESTVDLSFEAVAPVSARALRRSLVSDRMIDDVLAQAGDSGVSITGREGLLNEIIRAVLERGLSVELDDHLGYEKGDPAGRGSSNSRNGFTPKTLGTQVGDVPEGVQFDV